MRQALAMMIVLSIPALAGAEAKDEKPAQPPEVKQTVDAFKGKWTYDASLMMPGKDAPAKFKLLIDCKTTAAGKAVTCSGKASTPMGPWEAGFMVGFDPWSKAAHFMAMTSDAEVHDHVCHWQGEKDLKCDPLKAGMEGQPITEDLSFRIEAKKASFNSVTTLKDGSKMTFSAMGSRP